MKSRYLSLSLLSMAALPALAIPADPAPKTVIQPDGSKITVQMRGDEYSHAIYDMNGKQLRLDKASGMLVPTTQTLPVTGMRRSRARKPQRVLINDYPTKGKRKSLVVLFEFSDVQFSSMIGDKYSDAKTFYTDMLNQEGFTYENGADGSARDFYLASSDGQFDPDFVVVGPVRLPKESTYYGSDELGQDCRMGEAIQTVLDELDPEVDFSEFDANNDGIIDNIFFFYAGNGQADTPGGNSLIWPHSADVAEAWGLNLTYDGKEMHNYACSNEVRYSESGANMPSGIGTFVHEFGHVLGLADHYDTGYNMMRFDPGAWDTMASGSYNNNMNTPPLLSIFEREELGWTSYSDITDAAGPIIDLQPLARETKGFRVPVPGKENEWFVLENRQKEGWDKYLPGHGLLIWHVDMDEETWMKNQVNVDPNHQRLDIVEVDGRANESSRGGDVMPGTANITTFKLASWANQVIYTLDNVEETEDGVIRILPEGAALTLSAPAPKADEITDLSFKFTWDAVPDALEYKVTVSCGGKPLAGFNNNSYTEPKNFVVSDLSPETEYTIDITASRGSYTSEVGSLTVKTEKYFFERRLPGTPAATVSDGGFIAVWDAVDDADSYLVSLNSISRMETAEKMGYGFTEKANGMPAGWESSSSSYTSVDGYYGEASPALRFSADEATLTISYPETLLDGITFWQRSNGKGGVLVVEVPGENGWTEVMRTETSTEEGATVSAALNGVEKVRIRFEREGGYVAIDDVTVEGRSLVRTPVAAYDGSTVSEAKLVCSGLPIGLYGLTVTGLRGTERSLTSAECLVDILTSSGVSVITSGAYPVSYTSLAGIVFKTPHAGMNIVLYSDGSRRKEMHTVR